MDPTRIRKMIEEANLDPASIEVQVVALTQLVRLSDDQERCANALERIADALEGKAPGISKLS